MNLSDLNAADFARATIDFQRTHDFDFIKVMSNPYYMIEDMGLEAYLLRNEPVIKDAIDRFQELNLRYMEELLRLGVDGFFYAVEYADDVWSSDDIYERFFKEYDMEALRSVSGKTFFTMLHACGDCGVRLDRIADYPVDAVNWSDQSEKNPSLRDAASVMTQLPVGGIDHRSDMKGTDRDLIKSRLTEKVRSALEATGGRVILAGGCVFDVADTYRFGLWREVLDEIEGA